MVSTQEMVYRRWKRNLLTVSIGCFIIQASFTVITPLLPIFLKELGTASDLALWSGLVFSGSSLASALMAPVWGSLSDRFGERVMLIRAGFAIAASYGLTAFATSHVQVLWLRIAVGSLAGYIPAATMLIAANTPDEELGFAMGVLQTTIAVGTITGPLIGGVLAEAFSIRGAFVGGAVMPAIAALLALYGVKETKAAQGEARSVLGDIRAVVSIPALQALSVILMLTQAGALVVQPTLPLFISQLVEANVPLATGVVFSLFGVSTAIAAPLVGRWKDCSYISMLAYSLFASAVLSALQGLSRSILTLGILRLIFGVPGAAMSVAINVLIAQAVSPETRGRAFGVMNGVSYGGAVLGPLIGGFLGSRFGVRSSFFGCAVLYGIAATGVVASMRLLGNARRPGTSTGGSLSS